MQVLVMFGIIAAWCIGLLLLWGFSWMVKEFVNLFLKKKDHICSAQVGMIIGAGFIVWLLVFCTWMIAGDIIERNTPQVSYGYEVPTSVVTQSYDEVRMSQEFYDEWLRRMNELESQVEHYKTKEKLLWGEDK